MKAPFPITIVLDGPHLVPETALRIAWLCKLAMGFHRLLDTSPLQQKAETATHRQYRAVQTAQAEPVLRSPTAQLPGMTPGQSLCCTSSTDSSHAAPPYLRDRAHTLTLPLWHLPAPA